MAFTDAMPLITAWANDTEYERIFAEQVATWASPGDLLIAISGSGNSPNVLRAVEEAKARGATTIGLTGFDGGKLAKMADKVIIVPSDNMQKVEDVHVVLAHVIYTCLYREIGGCG
jgi:D-sedoheptulose 7-phosphate isomerase